MRLKIYSLNSYNTVLILVTIKRYLFNPAAGVLAIGVNTGYVVYAE